MEKDTPHLLYQTDFDKLKEYFYEKTGILIPQEHTSIFLGRLKKRMEEKGFRKINDYLLYLKYDRDGDTEFQNLLEVFLTKETYFFREERAFKALSQEIIPEIMEYNRKVGRHRIKIWSAGCSTGEEAYSIAMVLDDVKGVEKWNVEIVGTDISMEAIRKAREGVYKEGSFRVMRTVLRAIFFDKVGNGLFKVKDGIRSQVRFVQHNLLDERAVPFIKGDVDVIMCRNVLIYFGKEARRKTAEIFYKALRKGGYLILGHAESLINVYPLFKIRHLRNDIIYQKPED